MCIQLLRGSVGPFCFELRVLHFKTSVCHLSHMSNPFCFSHFSDRDLRFLLRLALDHVPPTYIFYVAGITSVHHNTHLVLCHRGPLIFCLGWPPVMILPISASLLAKIQVWDTERPFVRAYLCRSLETSSRGTRNMLSGALKGNGHGVLEQTASRHHF
jgi:hypothetical protein